MQPEFLRPNEVVAVAEDDGTAKSREAILRIIRRAIRDRRVVEIEYDGIRRVVEPHRLWQTHAGAFLLEAFQTGGWVYWFNFLGVELESEKYGPLPTLFDDIDDSGLSQPVDAEQGEPLIEGTPDTPSEDDDRTPVRLTIPRWISAALRKLKRVFLSRRTFVVQSQFNPNPDRKLGRIEVQVATTGRVA